MIKKHPLLLLPWLIITLLLMVSYFIDDYNIKRNKAEVKLDLNTDINNNKNFSTSNIENNTIDYISKPGVTNSTDENIINSMEVCTDDGDLALSLASIKDIPAGTILNKDKLGDTIMDDLFYYEEVNDQVLSRISGISYPKDYQVPLKSLRYVKVLHYGFDEAAHVGELIVNAEIAGDIVDIFYELYEAKYPIDRMVLVDEYNGDDNASMAANNTSSFNYRTVPGATHLSKHAYGLAIDVNPLYNPYIQYNEDSTIILPEEGLPYADRTLDNPYYIKEGDVCYEAFIKRGFSWGGFWTEEPDYQHFQKSLQ